MEEFKIEIETTGDYKTKKEFNKVIKMSERQFLALVSAILDFFDSSDQIDDLP